jgi:Dyp-type peroxidase family
VVAIAFKGGAVQQTDVQGNILCGYGRDYGHGLFLFLGVRDPAAARRWIAGLAERVTSAVPWERPPQSTLNVAFTAKGLSRLEITAASMARLSGEFLKGMQCSREKLGDTGESSPDRWQPGIADPELLVTVTARSAATRDRALARLRAEAEANGLHFADQQLAAYLLGGREPFGFRDGISQPAIRDPAAGPHRRGPSHVEIAPGEFVLGYTDEAGSRRKPPPLAKNGSYAVVRKLEQDVDGFWDFIRHQAGPDGGRQEWLAAKLVGRWRDGTPTEISPDRPSVRHARSRRAANDFRYAGDPRGYRCPIGAHIRRTNPRDGLDADMKLTLRHRIIRRGMPYPVGPGDPRPGLMFVCYQADIRRQFEFVQSEWCNHGEVFGLGTDPDPLVGPARGKLTVQGRPPLLLDPASFVRTRGGGYFLVPGIEALRHIGRGASAVDS